MLAVVLVRAADVHQPAVAVAVALCSVAMRVVGTVCGAQQTGASRISRVSSRSHKQRTNNARTAHEQRTNSVRTACEQRANSGCELARNKPP